MTDDELAALVGHRFPGGRRTVERWENWLLTDCTRRAPMTDGLLHPIVLFHVPIQAAQTSIGELFELFGNDAAAGSVSLLGYDWEYPAPMREGIEYVATGGIVAVERIAADDGTVGWDDMSFSIELHDGAGDLCGRITNHWRFHRSQTPAPKTEPVVGSGPALPALAVDDVGADRMKTMAAILRDPYPVHWDPEALVAAGLDPRPINQGPLNLGYIANMLMAWAGDGTIRRLTVTFHGRVLAGDTVVAGGSVERERDVGGERIADCVVWLDRDGRRLVSGRAEVVSTSAGADRSS